MAVSRNDYYPKKEGQAYGYVMQYGLEFDVNKDFTITLVFAGQGEEGDGSEVALRRMMNWPLFKEDAAGNPTVATSVKFWPVVYFYVQSTKASAYRSGEIDFIKEQALKTFPTYKKRFSAICISMGGFIAEKILSRLQAGWIGKIAMIMTGNTNTDSTTKFCDAVIEAKTELLFFHALDDTTAKPALSVLQNEKVKNGGGKSEYVMYEKGGHAISGHPLTGFYPTDPKGMLCWNTTNKKTTPDSYKPDFSVYQFLQVVGEPTPPPDKRILVQWLEFEQTIWQRPDGSVYTTEVQSPTVADKIFELQNEKAIKAVMDKDRDIL